jgi:pimeloyl-ACP methyl ester carboxylesterase
VKDRGDSLPSIDSNNISLAYETLGKPGNEAILLIAGLGQQLISWPDAFCQTLADQGFYVIRFDNRDCGLSTKMDEFGKPNLKIELAKSMFHLPLSSGYRLDDMAKDAMRLLDGLGIKQAHIVGASMGGMIAQIIAATSTHRTITLTSIMSTSGRPGLPGPTLAANNALLSRPANPRDLDGVIDHFVEAYRVLGSPAFPIPETVLRERVAASIRRSICPAGTARQLMAIAASGDRVALLRTVKAPTLVIHGTDDPLVPIACGRDTAYLVPGAVMHEIKGMGHDFPPGLDAGLSELIATHCKENSANAAR